MIPKASLLSIVAAAILLLGGCGNKTSTVSRRTESAQAKHEDRKPAPDFTLKDQNGNDVQLSQYRGRAVLLNFWATWCGPCNLEIPWFVEFQKELQSKGFEVLGVSMDTEGWGIIKPFLVSHKVNYRIVLGNDAVGQLYGGVDSLPTSFILDKQGRIAFVHVGLAGKNEYLNEIESVLDLPHQTTTSASLGFVPALLRAPATK